jgi:hypothetical protein
VWNILRSFTIGTPAWEWIRQLDGRGNGRQGMIRLRNHYDGPDKRRARINEAEAIIDKLHYKGEQYMTFEKFVTKLTGAYQVLAHYDEHYSNEKKLRTLLSKINSNETDILSGVLTVRFTNPTFDDAINFLADVVRSSVQAQGQTGLNKPVRRVAAANTGGRNSFNRSAGGRSGRNSAGRSVASQRSGRDNFLPMEVWNQLSPTQRIAITGDQNKNSSTTPQHGGHGRGGRGYYRGRGCNDYGRGQGGRTIASVNIQRENEPTDMSQVTETVTPSHNAGQAFGSTQHQNYSSNNLNHTMRTNSTYNDDDRYNGNSRQISTIVSSQRKIAQTKSYGMNSTANIRSGQIESDNHADTHALGANCAVIEYTGRICTVAAFNETYKPKTDVKIVSAAMAWDDPETGETIILVFHEALWAELSRIFFGQKGTRLDVF